MSDQRELLSDAEVDFLLTSAGADSAEPPGPEQGGGQEREVTMRGDLEQINLADIFQTLAMSKMEGVLRLRNPLEERQIHCRDGFLRIHVPNRLVTRRLGQRLLHSGLIDVDALKGALEVQRRDKQPLGQILVERGSISKEALEDLLARQVSEDLFALFTWRHGTFEFFKGEPSEALCRLLAGSVEYEVNSLLLEVARRADEWESIHAALGSLDDVPAKVAEPQPGAALGDVHQAVLAAANGFASYREIADTVLHGLFEVARAARDLVRTGVLANIDEAAMVEVARRHTEGTLPKRTLLTLQCLRDRPGERAVTTLQGMAKVLEKVGERKQAGAILLEAAQRQTDAAAAVDLARDARRLAPHDLATLTFLRTVLVQHAPAGTPELEQCTIDLLDALIEADQVPQALAVIQDVRSSAAVPPAVLQREARARQKSQDIPGATKVLEELARYLESNGEHKQAIEAWDALLRLDRSRKDVQKLLVQRRRSRLDRIIRIAVAGVVTAIAGGMGVVFWQQHTWTRSLITADHEITALLDKNDAAGARARLEQWSKVLGEGDATEDLKNRIALAEAAEAGRQQKLFRQRVNSALEQAAGLLEQGELRQALAVYAELAADPKARGEAIAVANTRLDTALMAMAQTAKALETKLPPSPATVVARSDLLAHQDTLAATCPPGRLRGYEQLAEALASGALPDFVSADYRERATRLLAECGERFRRAKNLQAAYAEALARSDQQRQLDPLFKAAVESERNHDFATALTHYRELERQPSNPEDLRTHFRDRVARNATIVRLMSALQAATSAADFATAQQQLRALRLSFPDVPFDRLVRLPMRIDSFPSGATVTCNGKEIGRTPVVLSRVPAETVQIEVDSPSFQRASLAVTGDEDPAWLAYLYLPADHVWRLGSSLAGTPTPHGDGLLVADRAGDLELRDLDGGLRWRCATADLSGLLSRPLVHGGNLLVASLDGDLRALAAATGAIEWSLPDLPTEVAPVLVGSQLFVATTGRRLHRIGVQDRSRSELELAEAAHGSLFTHAGSVLVVGEGGRVQAFHAETMRLHWQATVAGQGSPVGALAGGMLVLMDERGRVTLLDASNGQQRWQHDVEGETLGRPLVAGDQVWVATRQRLVRLALATGAESVRCESSDQEWGGAPTLVGNRLVVPLQRGDLQVHDAGNGATLYRIRAERQAEVHTVGSRLLVAEADGSLHLFDSLR